MSEPLTATIDNSCFDDEYLRQVEEICNFPIEIAVSSVTLLENDWAAGRLEAHIDASPFVTYLGLPILEGGVWAHSAWGKSVYNGDSDSERLEEMLAVISDRSFPALGERENLLRGFKRQLRDAMMFEVHVRHGRDWFVTNDRKGFVNEGRREVHQALYGTRIATPDEFLAELQERSLS